MSAGEGAHHGGVMAAEVDLVGRAEMGQTALRVFIGQDRERRPPGDPTSKQGTPVTAHLRTRGKRNQETSRRTLMEAS
jgi:hypothetical protein